MEPDDLPAPDPSWIAAIYCGANSLLALDPAITAAVGPRLAALFAAGMLACVLVALIGRCHRTPEPAP